MDVLMPQLGETVSEGKITKWFKSAGERVKPGDNLFEIETDKVSMEVPSTTTGVLTEIRVAVGAVAAVGAIVAVISDAAGAAMSAENSARSRASGNPVSSQDDRVPAFVGTSGPGQPQANLPLGPRVRGDERKESGVAPTSAGPIKLDPFFEVR